MSGKKTVVRVMIVGEEYTLRSDADAERAQAVASHVDLAIRKVMESAPAIDARKAAILAALQITDDLLKANERSELLAGSIRSLSDDLRRVLPPSKRGSLTPI
jgi:cell division protein ZapA